MKFWKKRQIVQYRLYILLFTFFWNKHVFWLLSKIYLQITKSYKEHNFAISQTVKCWFIVQKLILTVCSSKPLLNCLQSLNWFLIINVYRFKLVPYHVVCSPTIYSESTSCLITDIRSRSFVWCIIFFFKMFEPWK